MSPESDRSFGSTLRAVRRDSGFTLQQLAARCGADYTHLSRIETGGDRIPSRSLFDRLIAAFDDPAAGARIAAAAGRLTSTAEQAVSAFPYALVEPGLKQQALPALRRIEAGVLAEGLLKRTPRRGIDGGRINPEVLCRVLGLRPIILPGQTGPAATFGDDTVEIRDRGKPGDADAFPRVRFLVAHAAAHALRGQRHCTFPYVGDDLEPIALDIAAHLLSPLHLLESAYRAALHGMDDGSRNPWASQFADVATAVAGRLAIPGWVAVRRLADEALLDDDAPYYSPGDQP